MDIVEPIAESSRHIPLWNGTGFSRGWRGNISADFWEVRTKRGWCSETTPACDVISSILRATQRCRGSYRSLAAACAGSRAASVVGRLRRRNVAVCVAGMMLPMVRYIYGRVYWIPIDCSCNGKMAKLTGAISYCKHALLVERNYPT